MRHKLKCITPLFAAGFAAVAIAAAPIAAADSTSAQSAAPAPADPQPSCASLGGTQTECQSSGNAQVYDAPPQVDYFPYAGGGT